MKHTLLLLQSSDILPDPICYGLVQSNPSEIKKHLKNFENFGRINQTSIGNILCLIRGFPDDKEVQDGKAMLKGWLRYIYLKTDPQFLSSLELCKVLSVLNTQ